MLHRYKGCISFTRSKTDFQLVYTLTICRSWVRFQVWALNFRDLTNSLEIIEQVTYMYHLCLKRYYSTRKELRLVQSAKLSPVWGGIVLGWVTH